MATNTKTLLTVKVDKKLKEEAARVAKKLGMPLGTMVVALIKQVVKQRYILLRLDREAFPVENYDYKLREDQTLDILAAKRDTKQAKFVSHKKVWK